VNDAFGMPQTAVVVGGSSEIAAGILRQLAARRLARVLLAGRDATRLEQVAGELAALGVEARTRRLDVTETAAHTAFVEEASSWLGQVDLVLAAAGVLGPDDPLGAGPGEVAEVFGANCTGPAALAGAFARLLRDQGQGRLVVLSSVAGVRVRRANFLYGASKAGLDAFAQGLAMALEGSGASVMIVRPGWVATRMTEGRPPAPFATAPDAVARDVLTGLERGAAVVWSPPVLRGVFATMRLLPAALWRRLPG
jgi:decaprenylphospho-beta-D-erythro-pentofuranosid-2-ulose 2-reductase